MEDEEQSTLTGDLRHSNSWGMKGSHGACLSSMLNMHPQKISQPRRPMHPIVLKNKSKEGVKLGRGHKTQGAGQTAPLLSTDVCGQNPEFYLKTFDTLKIFVNNNNHNIKTSKHQILSHRKQGKQCWELKLQSGREREGGKRKQCEAAPLKSVKKIKCEFDECEVWDILSKREGKQERGGKGKKKAVPAANSPSTKFWPRCRSKAAI